MSTKLQLNTILAYLEAFAPPCLAAEWDNVGLLLGDRNMQVQRIMACLTITPESAAEAVEQGAQLIITHHPILFRPIQRLTSETLEGRMLLALFKAGIAVYSPHTALDNTKGGINDLLAERLGLSDITSLRCANEAEQFKLVVFVPDNDLARVSDALFAAGTGQIGQYSQCGFHVAGTGTFFGSDAANPAVGQKGRREEVAEWRLEVICPAASVEAAVAAVRKAHSYEEPAFDIYSLRQHASPYGEGRSGRLAQPTKLHEFAASVKNTLKSGLVQTVGDANQVLERVAIVCGAGGEFLQDAVRARADVLLTGEMRFHDYLAAQAQGLALVLPGHYATERCGVEALATQLQARFPTVQVWASRCEHDPVSWVR